MIQFLQLLSVSKGYIHTAYFRKRTDSHCSRMNTWKIHSGHYNFSISSSSVVVVLMPKQSLVGVMRCGASALCSYMLFFKFHVPSLLKDD